MADFSSVSSGAIILRDIEGELKIALAYRPQKQQPWGIPKGHVEPGETIVQAALREIREETGLRTVQLIKHLGTIQRDNVKKSGDVEHKTIHYYLAYAPGNDLHDAPTDPSYQAAVWLSPQEVLERLPHEVEQAFFNEHLAQLLVVTP